MKRRGGRTGSTRRFARVSLVPVLLMVFLAAVGCTSGTTAPKATGTEPPPSVSTATSSPASSVVSSAAAAGQDTDWPTYDRTADRSGVSVSSPAPGTVRSSWTASVDGSVYAQPLVVGSEVIVATENDTVYAIPPASRVPRWPTWRPGGSGS